MGATGLVEQLAGLIKTAIRTPFRLIQGFEYDDKTNNKLAANESPEPKFILVSINVWRMEMHIDCFTGSAQCVFQ